MFRLSLIIERAFESGENQSRMRGCRNDRRLIISTGRPITEIRVARETSLETSLFRIAEIGKLIDQPAKIGKFHR